MKRKVTNASLALEFLQVAIMYYIINYMCLKATVLDCEWNENKVVGRWNSSFRCHCHTISVPIDIYIKLMSRP